MASCPYILVAETLLAANGGRVAVAVAAEMAVANEENGRRCSLSFPSCVGSGGDTLALVSLFLSLMLLGELIINK